MIEVARRRASELGLNNVDFAVIDAQELELEPGSFDAAVCRWGFMLMGDPNEAMRRTRLSLRDGGRLAVATWDRPDRNLWMAAPAMALVAQGVIPPPNPSDPSPFALHDPADLERRLRSAGFASVHTDRIEFPQRYPSFDEYWAESLDCGAPIAVAVAGLQAAQAEAVRSATRETLSQFISADGHFDIPASTVVAVAVA
jgi:SAM-dependent methyltransferase